MQANEYQILANRTLIDDPGQFTAEEIMIVWNILGLGGEAGEVARLINAAVYGNGMTDALRADLIDELGDVMWYISALCTKLDFDLSAIIQVRMEHTSPAISPTLSVRSAVDSTLLWALTEFVIHAGNAADIIKKGIFHRHGMDSKTLGKLATELGETVAYLRFIANLSGIDLATIMSHNIGKLKRRYPQGFSYEDSLNRQPANGKQPDHPA